jgi:hypothetical protein
VRPNLKLNKGFAATGEVTGQWLHNRHFIRLESISAGPKYQEEATVLFSYDAKKKVYRRWLFASSGLATESEGQWNESKRTMTWKPLEAPQPALECNGLRHRCFGRGSPGDNRPLQKGRWGNPDGYHDHGHSEEIERVIFVTCCPSLRPFP